MTERRWSQQARKRLTDMQEEAYARLGEREGLGADPRKAYLRFGAGRIPAERLSAQKFEETFASTWGKAEGWGVHRERIDHYLQTYHQVPVPTPYEDPNWYPTLLEMADAIEQATTSTSRPIQVRPLFGSLPFGDINARVFFLGSTQEYIVLFEHLPLHFHLRDVEADGEARAALGTRWDFRQILR